MKQRIHCAALATTLCLALLPVQAAALTVTDRPQPGTTQGQPFEHDPDTAGSDSFRIPGLTTLRDGALLAHHLRRRRTGHHRLPLRGQR